MLIEFISNFNWIDLLMLAVLCRMVFKGMRSNLLTEVFSLIGTVVAVFVTLHYYNRFAAFLHEMVFVPEMVNEFFALVILWLTVHIVFKVIIAGWSLMIKTEAHPVVNQWGGLFLSLIRGIFVCSLLLFIFIMAGNTYLRQMAARTIAGKFLMDLAPNVYNGVYDNILVKYFPNEPYNDLTGNLRDLMEQDQRKKKK